MCASNETNDYTQSLWIGLDMFNSGDWISVVDHVTNLHVTTPLSVRNALKAVIKLSRGCGIHIRKSELGVISSSEFGVSIIIGRSRLLPPV